MTTKAKEIKKDMGPFTPTFDVVLSLHNELPAPQKPVYEFRAATMAERHRERVYSDRIDNIGDEDPETVDVDAFVMELVPIVENRLVSVKVGGKPRPEEMDLEERLDASSIIELFRSSILHELPSIAQKKRLLFLSNLPSEDSADPAKDAPANPTFDSESLNSPVPSATGTDAKDAGSPVGLK